MPAVASSKIAASHTPAAAKAHLAPSREDRGNLFSELLDSAEPRRAPSRPSSDSQRDARPDEPPPPRDQPKTRSTEKPADRSTDGPARKTAERDLRSESRQNSRAAKAGDPQTGADETTTSEDLKPEALAAAATDALADAAPAPDKLDSPDDVVTDAAAIAITPFYESAVPAAAIAVPTEPLGESAAEAALPAPQDGNETILALAGRPTPTKGPAAETPDQSAATPETDADAQQMDAVDTADPAMPGGKPAAQAATDRFVPAQHKTTDPSSAAHDAMTAKLPDGSLPQNTPQGGPHTVLHTGLNATSAAHHATVASAAQAPATPTPASVPITGLAVEIAARASAGKNRFEIRLDPPELGKIDVRLDIDKHGHVTSRLIVEKAETLDLLRRDAPQLERALQDAGLKTSGDGLQFSLQQQTPQQRDDSDAPARTAEITVTDEVTDINLVQRGYARLAAARGGVDIRI